MKIFVYKLNYLIDTEEHKDYGLVFGENYADAMKHITKDYGEDNLIDVYLQDTVTEAHCINKDDIDYAFEQM